jgi:chorismate dehydratase
MLAANDAALIIGDPGMTFPHDDYHVWDLAALWNQYTGLGFVFAMWMIRDDAAAAASGMDFAGARDEGLVVLSEIVDHYEKPLSLSRESMLQYLTENISFTPDAEMLAGLQLYFQLAYKHGLIDAIKPLQYG